MGRNDWLPSDNTKNKFSPQSDVGISANYANGRMSMEIGDLFTLQFVSSNCSVNNGQWELHFVVFTYNTVQQGSCNFAIVISCRHANTNPHAHVGGNITSQIG